MVIQLQNTRRWCLSTVGATLFFGLATLVFERQLEYERIYACTLAQAKAGREFDYERQTLLEHSSHKRTLIGELIYGRITLREASEICLLIDNNWPRVMASLRRCKTGNSDLECEARCLAFIAFQHPLSPDDRILLVERLVTEFQELFPEATDLTLSDLSNY